MNQPPPHDESPGAPLEDQLSMFLDGALDEAERVSLEKRVAEDPALAGTLSQLRRQRQWLRQLYRSTPATLPESFADRVVDAAIDRARVEGLDEDHPLILAGDRPSIAAVDRSSRRGGAVWRRLAVTAAMAASLGGLWFLGGRLENREPNIDLDPATSFNALASTPTEVTDGDPSNRKMATLNVAEVEREIMPDAENPIGMATEPKLAASANDNSETNKSSIGEMAGEATDRLLANDVGSAVADANADTNADMIDGLAAIGSKDASKGVTEGDAEDAMTSFAGAVMVFEVVCNDTASSSMVFADAMRAAGLRMESQQQITDGMVAAATEAAGTETSQDFQILYLSASAKRIDRLYLELLGDRQNVRGVGLSVALSAPIVAAAEALSNVPQDPTKVQQNGVAFPVSVQGTDGRAFAENLTDLTFLPITAGDGLMGGSVGGDEVAQAIFILR